MITLLKAFGLRKTLRVLYDKHILGHCRHCCDFCKYRNDCFDNVLD